ncbi:MAG: hypothetical protein CL780_06940 [Chloroflexi bacterium]|nr:hypothetical protein [Chloroflexota bacterium]|tara:strand:- start:391 stop:1122 length:732 start_codon:yes stop_codon:yes gene_type:complete
MGKVNKDHNSLDTPVSMVMCVYNEEDHIKHLILDYYRTIYKKLPSTSEFIIYLDGPTDGSSRIVNNLSKLIDIKVIEKQNSGYAKATTNALLETKNDLIFYSDSSGKHSAKDFWKLIKYCKEYDIITGFRYPRNDPFVRQIISFMQIFLICFLYRLPIHDFNTGFKLINRKIIDNVLLDCKYMKQSFSSELLIRSIKKGYKVKSVPVTFKNRKVKGTGTTYSILPGMIRRSWNGYYSVLKENL